MEYGGIQHASRCRVAIIEMSAVSVHCKIILCVSVSSLLTYVSARVKWFALLLACFAVGHSGVTASAQAARSCAETLDGGADADLYCIELLPAANIDGASGTARLLSPPSPFGVAVTAAGEHQYDIQFDVQGLPPPSSLGAFTVYVAWATTPQMHPVVKLGT